MRVLMAAGGTGGHLIPAIRIAEAIKRQCGDSRELELLFVGSDRGFEKQVIERRHHRYEGLPARGFSRTRPWRNFAAVWSNIRARSLARTLVRDFAPDVAVGCGGYASYFPVRAAGQAGIPYALQEQNRLPGLATRWLASEASAVFAAFEESRRHLAGARRLEITGNPIDPRLATMPRREARRAWGLPEDQRVILVTGGSGGARSINANVGAGLNADCDDGPVTVLWQTGRHKADWDGRVGSGWTLQQFEFTDSMTEAFVAADVVIARSGALTISELSAAGRPAVLVPFPHATDDHQTHNARVLVDAGAAILVPDRELPGRSLLAEAVGLLRDSGRRERMGNAARAMGKPDAADRIAAEVISLAEGAVRGDHTP